MFYIFFYISLSLSASFYLVIYLFISIAHIFISVFLIQFCDAVSSSMFILYSTPFWSYAVLLFTPPIVSCYFFDMHAVLLIILYCVCHFMGACYCKKC